MLKKAFIFFVLLGAVVDAAAKSPFTVTYRETGDQDIIMIMGLMDITSVDAHLSGDIKGKKAVLTEFRVKNGVKTSSEHRLFYPMPDSAIILKAKARKVSEEKIKLYIAIKDTFYFPTDIEITDDHHILIETALEEPIDDDIPVFAYSCGIKKDIVVKGEKVPAIDYCGLRDSKVHPALWHEKFGIADYIYYTIRFELSFAAK